MGMILVPALAVIALSIGVGPVKKIVTGIVGSALVGGAGIAAAPAAQAVNAPSTYCRITAVEVHDASLVKFSTDRYYWYVEGQAIYEVNAACPVAKTVKVRRYKKVRINGKKKWRWVTRYVNRKTTYHTTNYVTANIFETGNRPTTPGPTYFTRDALEANKPYVVGSYHYVDVTNCAVAGTCGVQPYL